MKQINLQKIQNKLRNKFIKSGVKMIDPETIFFFRGYKDWKKCNYRSLCCNWAKSKNRKQCKNLFLLPFGM